MLEKFLRKSWFPLTPRLAGLFFFIVLMLALFYGSVKILNFQFTSQLAMLLVWTLWWPFLYLTLFLMARGWCGFLCPLSLANEAGNSLREGKRVNVVRWSFVAYLIFFLVVYLEQISGLFLSPRMTLFFFSSFFALAFLMGLIWQRFSFCRLVCPIGTLLGVFSRLSLVGVRTDKEKCQKCLTKECLKGTEKAGPCPMYNNVPALSTNQDCLICTNCIKNCPHDSAKLQFIFPGKELVQKAELNLGEAFFIIALLGFTTLLTTAGTQMFRGILEFFGWELKGAGLRGADFGLALGIFLGGYVIVSVIITRIKQNNLKENLAAYAYAYLPLVFFIMTFSIVFGFLSPGFNLSENGIAWTKYFFLLAGLMGSIVLLFRLSRDLLTRIIHAALILGLGAGWVLFWIPGPLALFYSAGDVLEVGPGEVVQMEAYSMGFTPSTIIVEGGQPVVLNLTNVDINHAFDIDEFNTHLVIVGGKTARVMFTPDKVGEFKYYCSIPGHEEAGMKGKLIVRGPGKVHHSTNN